VPVRRSIRPDHLLCLVCGKPHKVLKRHLAVQHELTPAELPGALRAQARLSNGGSQLPPTPVGGGARDWPGAAEEAGSSWKEGGRTLTDGRTKPAAGDDAGV
jgi:ROS/MUCR transcriptional regulator protein